MIYSVTFNLSPYVAYLFQLLTAIVPRKDKKDESIYPFLQSMADETARNIISLKALVDKERNNVIFIESDNDFIDVLFSFLTIPMGTIVRNTRKHSVPMEIGCMSNLYASVEKIDVQHHQTEACRSMLLCPHSGVEHRCENLKLKIDDDEPTGYFLCGNAPLTISY